MKACSLDVVQTEKETLDEEKELIDAAEGLASEILNSAQEESGGISWRTMSMNEEGQIIWQENENLYSGGAGVALFLIELFSLTGKEEYLDYAKAALRWSIKRTKHRQPSLSFFAGRLGLSYVYKRAFETTHDGHLLDEALSVARQAMTRPLWPDLPSDFLSGTSGMLLVLCHLHRLTNDQHIAQFIREGTRQLIKRISLAHRGVYWGRTPSVIQGLCGFAHGASGIGFGLLELGCHFKSEELVYLAKQAFEYESLHLNLAKKNWPDYRQAIYKNEQFEVYKNAFKSGNKAVFLTGRDMNAWCHGATGIGLARLRAFQLLRDEQMLQQARLAIEKTTETCHNALRNKYDVYDSHTLCHGLGGHADLFLTASLMLENKKYLQYGRSIALHAIYHRRKYGYFRSGFSQINEPADVSLMMGIAGIGMLLLRAAKPTAVNSILLPHLPQNGAAQAHEPQGAPSISFGLDKSLIQYSYPRTIALLEHLIPDAVSNFSLLRRSTITSNIPMLVETFINFSLAFVDEGSRVRLDDIITLETKKREMDMRVRSFSYLYVRNMLQEQASRTCIALSAKQFYCLYLTQNDDVSLLETRWDWKSKKPNWILNLERSNKSQSVLLKLEPEGVSEVYISKTLVSIFKEFQRGSSVGKAIRELKKTFVGERRQEKLIAEGIRVLIKGGYLVPADP